MNRLRIGASLRDREDNSINDRPDLKFVQVDDEVCSPLEVCEAMHADLVREIASIKSDRSANCYPVRTVEYIGRTGPYGTYRLTVDRRLPPLRSESAVLLHLDADTVVPAQVLAAANRRLTIAVTQQLPEGSLEGARIVIDEAWLLERQQACLDRVRARLERGTTIDEFNIGLAQQVLGEVSFEDNEIGPVGPVPGEITSLLNEQQQTAVLAGMTRRVTYLWGPAGTGKTTTLAALIHAQVLAGRRVLVVAPSNASADVLAMAVAARLADMPRFDRGLMLRVGPRPSRQLSARYGRQLVPQHVADRLAEDKRASRKRSIEQEISDFETARARPGASAGLREHLRVRLLDCAKHLAELDHSVEDMRKRCFDEILKDCQVLVTPIHNVYLSRQLRGKFDLIVVDEVSMVTLPQLYLAVALFTRGPMKCCTSQVLLAGDFRQLAAPVAHPRPANLPWLSRDIFEKLGIPDDIVREDDPPYLVMLSEQYRMARPICSLVSELFYGGRLVSAPSIQRRKVPIWAGWGSLLLVDTSARQPRATIPRGTRSRQNEQHVQVVRELVDSMMNTEVGSHAGSLLVLSPYTSQVHLLEDALAPVRRRFGSTVRASSIHRAQGAEAETVLLTLDDAPGARVSQFMAARDWNSAGSRLLNVAVSRGRSRVVVIAAVSHLMREGGPVVRRFLASLEEHGQVIGIDDL